MKKDRFLKDGVYDVTGIETLFVDGEFDCESHPVRGVDPEVDEFVAKHPNYLIASAYETGVTFLLASKPKALDGKMIKGGGFNYGSTNIITNCPSAILILAEND